MARNLADVIEEILKVLPNDGSQTRLAAGLKNIKESVSYCPPESIVMWWKEFEGLINGCVAYPPKLPYEKAIFKIVTEKDFDEETFAGKAW